MWNSRNRDRDRAWRSIKHRQKKRHLFSACISRPAKLALVVGIPTAFRGCGMFWINLLGFTAALTVLASFCMTTIVSLRSVAIASNLLFILYGMLGHIYPVFFLHLTL